MIEFAHPPQPLMFSMIVTPMDERGQVDEDGVRAHLGRMVDAGVGVYLGSGGSGEGHALELRGSPVCTSWALRPARARFRSIATHPNRDRHA